jgi:LmbE family N-acetylglucosaminyl deacetylase
MSGDSVLVIAAHPDDEVLGCGGTLARHASRGDRVVTLFLADGASSRAGSGEREIGARREAASLAARRLGSAPPIFVAFPDNRMDSVPLLDIVQAIEGVLRETEPRIVYTHHGGDLNIDHRRVFEAALTACRPLPGHSVERLYAFEVPSASEWGGAALGAPFEPTRFVDIARWLDAKSAALDAYAGELRPPPHPRSPAAIESRQHWRGATAGMAAAEAFVVLRELDR